MAGIPAGPPGLNRTGANAGSRTRINGFGGHYTIHCATLARAAPDRKLCPGGGEFKPFPPAAGRGSRDQMWMASSREAAAASITASLNVGCAWMVWWISSAVASSSMASPYSAMSSVASLPMMCAP